MIKTRDEYSKNGFYLSSFSKTDTYERFLSTLRNLLLSDSSIPAGFKWESKYPLTEDIRPNVFDIDSCFVDILSENRVHDLLASLTGREDLTLSHIQIRKSNSEKSYMDWHRDSYPVDGKWIGNNPAVHKLIFYPKINESTPSLKILAGSHNCVWAFQKSEDMPAPGLSKFDSQIFNFHPVEVYNSSDSEFIVFNTSAIHGVIPDPPGEKTIRIIYSFVSRDQYEEKYSNKEHHKVVNSMYEKIK